MSQTTWSNVDTYFTELLIADDPVLNEVLTANTAAGLPHMMYRPRRENCCNYLYK